MPTRHRTIRVPDHIWDAANAKAEQEGLGMTAVIRRYLAKYAGVKDDEPRLIK